MAEPVTTGSNRERVVLSQPWRVGGSLGRTLFAQVGEEPERGPDICFGMLDTPTLAAAACAARNAQLEAMRPAGGEHDGVPVERSDPVTVQRWITATAEALRAEGVPARASQRVINWLVWGDPEGYREKITLNPEYAIRHPDGQVTISVSGQPYESRETAEGAAAYRDEDDAGCSDCGTPGGDGMHVVVYRRVVPWETV